MKFNSEYASFQHVMDSFFEFEKLMSIHGLNIRLDSKLEESLLQCVQLLDHYNKKLPIDNYSDIRPFFRNIIGSYDLINKILSVKEHPLFVRILPHIELLNNSNFFQNIRSSPTDQSANKVFELYMCLLSMTFSSQIDVDSPIKSTGDNPDVIFSSNGHDIGIACKVMHSDKVKTFFEKFVEGVEQIERSRCDTGFVVINMKNIINHDEFWPILNETDVLHNGETPTYGAFTSNDKPEEMLIGFGNNYYRSLMDETYIEEFEKIKYTKAINAIVLFLQTTVSIKKQNQPYPAIFGLFFIVPFKKIGNNINELFEKFNKSMHKFV